MKKWISLFLIFVFALVGTACNKQYVNETEVPKVYKHYCYTESDSILKPSVTLLEGNRFTFTFSAVSSYLGRGTYKIQDGVLVLNTDDGDYTYTFKIEGENMDRLIFDAENSSEMIHFGNFEDGAVFDSRSFSVYRAE